MENGKHFWSNIVSIFLNNAAISDISWLLPFSISSCSVFRNLSVLSLNIYSYLFSKDHQLNCNRTNPYKNTCGGVSFLNKVKALLHKTLLKRRQTWPRKTSKFVWPFFNIGHERVKDLQKQSSTDVLLKGVHKIYSKFTGEHPCRNVILLKSHFGMGVLL